MKKIFFIILPVLFILGACRKNISSLNVDTKNPPSGSVPASSLFSVGLKNMVDEVTTSDVNEDIFRLISQYWTETTYTDESNYDLGTRDIPANWWRTFYKNVLVNYEEAKKYIPVQVTDAAVQKNQLAILDLMEVYTYATLVNTFGNIPYTDALDINKLFPKYDDAKTVYYALLTRLDADIAALSTSAAGFGNADLLYADDISLWKKFANSLKLRMGITLADYDAATAKTVVEAAAPNVFTSNADNAVFYYLGATPNNNPVWGDQVNSGRQDFIGTTTIVNLMFTLNDPRLPSYFTTASSGSYLGGAPGAGGSYGGHSHPPLSTVYAVDAPSTLLSYAEVQFILAEAVERGFSVGGTAASHYNNAVTASILEWGGTSADAVTYLAKPAVNYLTATGTYKQKIGTQKWLALYNRGFDAWVELRRLDYPVLPAPAVPVSTFPLRFTYPTSEQNLNAANWTQASTAVGGDEVTTKLFWDKF
jgi:Starch-binding associating with outer membrane